MSFWHKTGIDIVLVGLALYLLYNFNNRQEDLKRLALDSDALQVDPPLFLMPALFALGAGLLVLRVYPFLFSLFIGRGAGGGRQHYTTRLYKSAVHLGSI